MRAMAVHTRIGPKERIGRLMTLNNRLQDEAKVSCFKYKHSINQKRYSLQNLPIFYRFLSFLILFWMESFLQICKI